MASYNCSYFWNGAGFPGLPYGQNYPISQAQTESSQQSDESVEADSLNMEVKILNSHNKREFRLFSLRNVSSELINCPEKLKNEIAQQCELSKVDNMEVGYFNHAKKRWINNRLDLVDMWKLVAKGDKIVLWCVENSDNERAPSKRPSEDGGENEPPSKKRISATQQKVLETEVELKRKHGTSTYSNFQFKLWAEMYANGNHGSLDEPPAVAMFNRETKRSHAHGQADVMVSVIDKLCTALTPETKEKHSSPMKKAELRSTYIKQLSEFKMLHDNKILTDAEYTEQRDERVELMRQLKN